jgi:hypothetical protein
LSRTQLPTGGEERIAGAIFQVSLGAETETMQNTSLQIMRGRFPMKFLLKDTMKNLEGTWSIYESGSRAADDWRADCDAIAVTRIVIVQRKYWLEPGREIE